jgi:hypothetical protein
MSVQPDYFERIRLQAARRWDQLEQDPELAAPWYQLFKQVQSPRHVLSELLQNADDAGATEASVRIEDNSFIFEHNGEDFSAEHFASLCRFGYSNKRALHTIGFRGIGFKSTFSLGDCVELYTPTLAVSFSRTRFTEPHWQPIHHDTGEKTRVRVAITDQYRQKELEKNLEEWHRSPTSLLFFKHIRRLQIGDEEVHWQSNGTGPIANSEWMVLFDQLKVLIVRSAPAAFPPESLAEIRQERLLGVEDDMDFPPSTIDIVLGIRGRLFVVLPTGVETKLPFACNGPFLQDPARLKIKDPEISPTNRWLLSRAGRLAATAMLAWLGKEDLPIQERARAYGFFPDIDRNDASLEGACGAIAQLGFGATLLGRPAILADNGRLMHQKACVSFPKAFYDIWSADQAARLFDEQQRPSLCRHIEANHVERLVRRGYVDQIDRRAVLRRLQSALPPLPATWRQLMNLWTYVASDITSYRQQGEAQNLRIVPVHGSDTLQPAKNVVRLGERTLLQSEQDWEFLTAHLLVIHQSWLQFIAQQRQDASEQNDTAAGEAANVAHAILARLNLVDTSNVDKVIDQVARTFFAQPTVQRDACIRLAQIAAKLGAAVGPNFRFTTRDERLQPARDMVLIDEDGTLVELLPDHLQAARLLHLGYTTQFVSCSRDEWRRWVSSGNANLRTFVPLTRMQREISSRSIIEREAQRRGLHGKLHYPYARNLFIVEDWDFDEVYWEHWKQLAAHDDRVWARIVEHIARLGPDYWMQSRNIYLVQVASNGSRRTVTDEPLLPNWVLRLRALPCLMDTRGFLRLPGDLLRRTAETEPLIDVEPFLHLRLDTEPNRSLLDMLGVRSVPTGPSRLLDRLRALAKAEHPPVPEVEKWYQRLDQMLDACSTADFQMIQQAFQSEKLLLAQDGSWTTSGTVFLDADEEEVPGVAVVRPSVRELTLWRKVGVAERATAELAIAWLKTLPSGAALQQDDARRVRALLGRHPSRVWTECDHWLTLAGQWAPTKTLSYALTMQSLVHYQHLHPWVTQQTADLRRLTSEAASNTPFSSIPLLAHELEERLHNDLHVYGEPQRKEWLVAFAAELCRIEFDSEADTIGVREVAGRLLNTIWYETQQLEVIPYLGGTPAGTPRHVEVLWYDQILYVAQIPQAKLAKHVPDAIGSVFGRDEIRAALTYSFERSADDVRAYVEANFRLAPLDVAQVAANDATAAPAKYADDLMIVGDEPALDGQTGVVAMTPAHNGRLTLDLSTGESLEEVVAVPGEEEATPASEQQLTLRPRLLPRPARPTVIERFALAQGFQKSGLDRFVHSDGSSLFRLGEGLFPWTRTTPHGEPLRHYLPKEHCLEDEPLQLEAEIWAMFERFPETHALILLNTAQEPTEVSGSLLRKLRDEGMITLYPASYRLVYSHDN